MSPSHFLEGQCYHYSSNSVLERRGGCLWKAGEVSRKGGGACHGVSWRLENCKTLAFQGPFCLFKPSHHISSVYFILQQELIGILIWLNIYIYCLLFFFMHMHTQGTSDKKTHASTTSAYEIGQASSKNCLASVRSMRFLWPAPLPVEEPAPATTWRVQALRRNLQPSSSWSWPMREDTTGAYASASPLDFVSSFSHSHQKGSGAACLAEKFLLHLPESHVEGPGLEAAPQSCACALCKWWTHPLGCHYQSLQGCHYQECHCQSQHLRCQQSQRPKYLINFVFNEFIAL